MIALSALALAFLLSATAARAQDGLYNVSVADSTFAFQEPNGPQSFADAVIGHDSIGEPDDGFQARFKLNVNADANPGEGGLANSGDATLVVKFEVHSSRNYELNVTVALGGALTSNFDSPDCTGSADISDVEAFSSHLVTAGTLRLPDLANLPPAPFSAGVSFFDTAHATIRLRNPNPVEFHTLQFHFTTSVFSDACEASARLGAQNVTTQSCSACEYPGDPPRDANLDGFTVDVDYIPLECGDGQPDPGEECDLGKAVNGFGTCCTPDCQHEEDGVACTDDLFCTGDDRCSAGACIHPFGNPCVMQQGENTCFGVCAEATDTCDFAACVATPVPTTTPVPTPTATVAPASCGPQYNAQVANANAPNCTFCQAAGAGCSSECVGAEACLCLDGPDQAECCAERPCCTGCPDANSAPCTLSECFCTPDIDDCCATVCPCAGDCDGDGGVSIDELITGVKIKRAEANPLACISLHPSREGSVDAVDLVSAVDIALGGCNPTP